MKVKRRRRGYRHTSAFSPVCSDKSLSNRTLQRGHRSCFARACVLFRSLAASEVELLVYHRLHFSFIHSFKKQNVWYQHLDEKENDLTTT
mmetsp:Transcript_39887/g.125292  ORF Transcript_39887/g.125292 Transcript_39887/m.125292 type:complete len:90 (-) Transcript_39887:47-316(-)